LSTTKTISSGTVDIGHLSPVDILPEIDIPQDTRELQRFFPKLAKLNESTDLINGTVRQLKTTHDLVLGDSRKLTGVDDESVQLVLTSPPYWTLKQYPENSSQLGAIEDYDQFNKQLNKAWTEAFRVLVPGGRLVVVVGDVCLPRRRVGRHFVMPLHSTIQEAARNIGFDNLTPIIWHKIANAVFEAKGNGGGFLGKPFEPNAVIKNDIEFILMLRKPGGYRTPTLVERLLSVIPSEDHKVMFQQIWNIKGASLRNHPAPFPIELANRLIRMYSFAGDTVLDPYMGTGTTSLAAAMWGRNSISYDVEASYVDMASARLTSQLNQIRMAL